jgi:nitrogen regulatory protein P-II 2
MMTLLKAIVRPDKVDAVQNALDAAGIGGMTVTEVRGHGKQKGHSAVYRGKEYEITLLPKMSIDVVVPVEAAPAVIKAIINAARTGEIGDGRIFEMPVSHSYSIRTGELDAV